MSKLTCVYILAKNERCNIGRGLQSLAGLDVPVIVLDSGSTDGTQDFAATFAGTTVRPFVYKNHCQAYNEIIGWHSADEHIVILDADMQASGLLIEEIRTAIAKQPSVESLIAPVRMFWDGQPLEHCSLYPPKPIVFRGGRALFEPAGHGEHLRGDVTTAMLSHQLVHDDRKPLESVLSNQWRYAKDVVRRSKDGRLTRKDRLRLRTPLLMLITPLYAFVVKRGFLDGRIGIIYAIDRLIAEALTYRASLSPTVREEIEKS